MPDTEFCFIINPAASGGGGNRHWSLLQELLDAAKVRYCYHVSQQKGHCAELTRNALQGGQRNFVAVGGDGTANEVLNGIFKEISLDRQEVTLSVVPWGTGNDWASYYGFSARPEACIDVLRSGVTLKQDIGKVSYTNASGQPANHFFLNCAGTGFDSFLLEKMGGGGGRRLRYLLYLLKCLVSYRATPLRIDIDGDELEYLTTLLEVCIGDRAGAGMRFAPRASADDGLFEVLLIDKLSTAQLIRSLTYIYNGRIDEHPAARRWRSPRLAVAAHAEQFFHCDGELVGRLPIRLEILPRAVSIMIPSAS
ncbi:diacylglycerol kinase family lipid kinase [Halieaceae bacterium IMCC14734]|uniref:Diacylglycerol kinase family lipid kinase n=1 Tax=Candidatus Litorirhabdus singularis TaxID=2518993 RepID=A0ABT3TGJ6_9GAMM|nr:diacylglycerol kinase family lipid kinase [Candidatus Litorirhabdus singularis]MCX2980549.1 diacylglycerol kinase family lipid kinase [Candidatus Litorirhabdus singularis]